MRMTFCDSVNPLLKKRLTFKKIKKIDLFDARSWKYHLTENIEEKIRYYETGLGILNFEKDGQYLVNRRIIASI